MKIRSIQIAARVATAVLVLSLPAISWSMQAPQGKPAAGTAAPKPAPTAAEIADAKAKGLVWVNLNSKVYHKDDRSYGNTKHGKFMSEADAVKAGYHLAKPSPIGKKDTPAQAPQK
jgi:hypothetical protein